MFKMNLRTIITILVAAALAAGLLCVAGCRPERAELVRAWQLTPDNTYSGPSLVDEAMSWSPDSKSLIFQVVSTKGNGPSIMRWVVGEKQIERVTRGTSPNYTSNDTFVFLQTYPKILLEHTFSTNIQRQVAKDFEKVDIHRDVSGFTYDPVEKTYLLRISDFTAFYQPGCVAIDENGRQTKIVPPTTGSGVLDRSSDSKSNQSAVIFAAGDSRELRISEPGKELEAEALAKGSLGAVAWQPDGQIVAFGDSSEVKIISPKNGKIQTVARFFDREEAGRSNSICRLKWSPNGRYLAALNLVSYELNSYAVLYVLDMSHIK